MAFRRRKQKDKAGAVGIVAYRSGLIVQGQPHAVTAFIDQVTSLTNDSSGRARRLVADGLAVAGQLDIKKKSHREYFEFSPRAYELLKTHGAIPGEDGHFHSFVRSGDRIVGNLDWKPTELEPQQALAFQNAAVHLALRAAITDLTAAIERVEGKVDKLVSLARAERQGGAAGDRHTLQLLVEHTRVHGQITMTDWSTVGSLGTQIARDIEALRAYVHQEVANLQSRPFVRTRSSELKELTDELLRESLALLVVVEQNYMLWQEVRIAHIATHEPEALAAAVGDAHSQLDSMAQADQQLIDALLDAARELLRPTGYEGFLPLERRRLRKRSGEVNALVGWFAEQRHLDTEDFVAEYPTLGESALKAKRAVEERARETRGAIGSSLEQLRRRSRDPGEHHPQRPTQSTDEALELPESPAPSSLNDEDHGGV